MTYIWNKSLEKRNTDLTEVIILLFLFILSFSFYSHFVVYNVGGDGVSQYYPAKKLLEDDSLNLWNPLNNQYNTYYFKLPFTDEVIYDWNRSYPTQTLGTILLTAFIMGVLGNNAFFYINPFFASITIIFIYLVTKKLVRNRIVATISSLILFSMPVFLIWAIIPQNIMPSTSFLVISLYFIIKFRNSDRKLFILLSGIFFAYAAFCRLPHFLFAPIYLIYFFNRRKKLKIDFKQLLYFTIPPIIVSILIICLNTKYFGDPLFIGYLRTEYRPPLLGYAEVDMAHKYFLSSFSLSALINSIRKFFIGTYKIYFPIFFLSLFGLFIKSQKNCIKKYKIFFFLSFTLLIAYYSKFESITWCPKDPKLTFSLSVTFFRYLLPVYVFSIPLLGIVLLKIYKTTNYKEILLLVNTLIIILSITYVNTSIAYEGGGSLDWYQEINEKLTNYSQTLPEKLEDDSIILYATRWAFSYTYPHTMDYNWFYYDGIPLQYRYNHTVNVVKNLLEDDKTVYIIKSPYEEQIPEVKEMFVVLDNNFILEKMPETYFNRMDVVFYKIKLKEE